MPSASTETSAASLREIIRAEIDHHDEPIDAATDLRQLPGIDSMKVLRIITRIERKFAVEMPDEVVFNVSTFGDLMQALAAAQADAQVDSSLAPSTAADGE